MKESFNRLIAWSKEHPYIAGAILLGVVVLAYLTMKRGGFSSSGASYELEEPETESAPDPGTALGSSDLSNLGTIPTLPEPAPASGGGYGGGAEENGSEGGYGAFDVAMPDPLPFTGSYALSVGSPVSSTASEQLQSFSIARDSGRSVNTLASAEAQRLNKGKPGTASGNGIKGTKQQPANVRPDRQPVVTVQHAKDLPQNKKLQPGAGVKGVKEQPKDTRPARTPATQPKPATKTPAEMVGKPKYFTGLYNGVVYAAGYPVRR